MKELILILVSLFLSANVTAQDKAKVFFNLNNS